MLCLMCSYFVGVIKMASSDPGDNNEIYDCSVCFHYMLDRTPRSLHCLHTFCEECLEKLVKDEQICCPTCRKVTPTPDGVKALPVNFILMQLKQSQAKRGKTEVHHENICFLCETHPASYLCKNCEIILCNICKGKHEDIGKYEQDEIVKLMPFYICTDHQMPVSVICMKCTSALCVKCTLLDHNEHSESFVDYWKGAKVLQSEMRNLYSTTQDDIKKITENQTELKEKVYSIGKKKRDLQQYLEVLKKMCVETEEKIKIIDTDYSNERSGDMFERFIHCKQMCNDAISKVTPVNIEDPEFDLCAEFVRFKEAVTEAREETELALKAQFEFPPIVPDLDLVEYQKIVQPLTTGRHLLKVGCVNHSNNACCKKQFCFVGNHLACISDGFPCHVVCLDANGKVTKKFFPEHDSEIAGIGTWKSTLFIAQQQGITVLPLGYDGEQTFYRKNFENTDKILPLDNSNIIISGSQSGTLEHWNMVENKTETVVKDLCNPFFMAVMYTNTGPVYIVNEWGKHQINIYDERWQLMYQFGKKGTENGEFDKPQAIAVTELGTLLVVDNGNKRVSHFTLNGKFLNNVITETDGISNPSGLAYQYPFLWVCNSSKTLGFRVAWD